MTKESEIKILVKETQNEIKAKLYGHGNLKKLSAKINVSKYKIRQTINEPNPDLELLAKIEKALLIRAKAA